MMAASLMRNARQLSFNCLRRRFEHLSSKQFARKLAEAWLQEDCPPHYVPTGSEMTWIQDNTELATQLHSIFTDAGVPYYITGGVAAITHGEPRTTRDLDIVLAISPADLNQLVNTLEKAGFYVSGVEDFIAGRMTTLQITHLETISRADLVIANVNEYEQLKFERRCLCPFPNGTEVYLSSPEDLIISKLRWGQRNQSEKQWRDVLGVLKIQQEDLDFEYLYQWASRFGLEEELEKATTEAGVRAIADQQWANSLFPTAVQAFKIAQQMNRITIPREGIERADGNVYCLIKDSLTQRFSIHRRKDEHRIAQFNWQGNVEAADPTLADRKHWQAIAQRVLNP